jgi:hypothetical protein
MANARPHMQAARHAEQSNRWLQTKPAHGNRGLSSGSLELLTAVPTGFEPAISSLTGTHVRPLHHGTNRSDRNCTGSHECSPTDAEDSSLLNGAFHHAQRCYQRFLAERQGEVAARLLDDAARVVGRTPQATGQRVGVVERHEE